MNLNDFNNYVTVIFKKKFYYMPKDKTKTLREVFMDYTRDGAKPNLGIQEIYMIELDKLDALCKMQEKGIFNRDEVTKLAKYRFNKYGFKVLYK